jgi:penicillin amidase
VADCIETQNDVLSQPGLELRDMVLDRLATDGDAEVRDAAGILRRWDGRLDSGSAGALLYEQLLDRLLDAVIGDHVSPTARRYLLGGSIHDLFPTGPYNTRLVPLLLRMLERGQTAPLADSDASGRDRLLIAATAATMAELRRRHGSDRAGWRWGDAHKLRFEHPIAAAVPALGRILSRGPFPSRGDNDTIRLSWHGATNGIMAPVTSAFWRAVYDLEDWSRSVGSHAPGQSGHPASRHYADLIDGWLNMKPAPLRFGIQPDGDRLVLRPLRSSDPKS